VHKVIYSSKDTVIENITDFDLGSTLECGQCFRWDKNDDNDYTGIVSGRAARVIQQEGRLVFKNTTPDEVNSFWYQYFDLGTDYGRIKEILSKDDPIMTDAVLFAPGIRILRQPLFETLVSFIVSANNSIPNIKRVISALSRMWGEEFRYDGKTYFAFPGAKALAEGEICDLQLTKAGYRCDYIKRTAGMFFENPLTANDLKAMDYHEAKELLRRFPGVGAKVADCTILFSGSHFRAFPVDVWIKKVMEQLYLKEETPLQKISDKAYDLFGNMAGYAQQYLFHYARMNRI